MLTSLTSGGNPPTVPLFSTIGYSGFYIFSSAAGGNSHYGEYCGSNGQE
ncbi:hypothetical protein [Phormidesmis sp. 146-33]